MTMGVVDTVMVGPLGPEAISAAGVGNAMHIAFAIFGMAVMLGLDTLVSHAYGARDIRDCHRWFFDGLMLAGLLAVPIMALLVLVWFAIPSLGFHGAVRPLLESVLRRPAVEHAVPARLRSLPPLPAGDARSDAGHVRARHRERDQRRRQLGPGLRPPRFPGSRRRRIGVGDGDLARLHVGSLLFAVWWIDRKAHARSRDRRCTGYGTSIAPSTRRGCGHCSRSGCRPHRRWARKSACSRWPRRCRARSIRSRAPRTRSRSTWPASRS